MRSAKKSGTPGGVTFVWSGYHRWPGVVLGLRELVFIVRVDRNQRGEEGVCLWHGWVTLWRVRNMTESPHLVYPVEVVLDCYGKVVLCVYKVCFNMLKYRLLVLQPL